MANFSNLVTTTAGHEFITKFLASGSIPATQQQGFFSKIVASSAVYQMNELEGLVSLEQIGQETLISAVLQQNETTIKIHGRMDNTNLTTGYRLNTLGVYFRNPDDGLEHLFGVAIHQPTLDAPTGDFIFPFNGLTTTTLLFDLLATVGNAENISLTVDPAATVTIKTLEAHNTNPNAHADIRQGLDHEGGRISSLGSLVMQHVNEPTAHAHLFDDIRQEINAVATTANAAANPAVMSQAVAEAGTSTTTQSVTAQRLRQAANAAINAAIQNGELGTGGTGTTNVWHGTSSTAAGTVAKVVELSAGQPPFVRELGTIVIIRFTNANTAASPTMNIEETGAANIRIGGLNVGGISLWPGNLEVMFSWDGTGWNIINPMVRTSMIAGSVQLPGTPSIGIRPSAASNATHIPDTSWVRSRIEEATSGLSTGLTDHIGTGGTAHANAEADGEAGFMTGADKSKLDSIPANAAANPATMTQAQAQAGTSTTVQSVTAQRLRQAANAAINAARQNGELGTTNVWHGTSGTAAGTAAKVVTLSADQPPFVRQLGTIVIIRFTHANTNSLPTMNIGATGAANIRHTGANIGGSLWRANQDVIFSWDGTGWAIVYNGLATTTHPGYIRTSMPVAENANLFNAGVVTETGNGSIPFALGIATLINVHVNLNDDRFWNNGEWLIANIPSHENMPPDIPTGNQWGNMIHLKVYRVNTNNQGRQTISINTGSAGNNAQSIIWTRCRASANNIGAWERMPTAVVDNLTSTSVNMALSANQGRLLNNRMNNFFGFPTDPGGPILSSSSVGAFEAGTWFPDLMGTNAHTEVAKYQVSGQKVTASFKVTCFGIDDEIALGLWDLPIFPQSPITSAVYIIDGEQKYTAQFIDWPHKPDTAVLHFNDTPNGNGNFTIVAEINYFI